MRLRNINKILITGLPRTGTTFFGNFLGSAKNVEYFFEPPMMSTLLNCIGDIDFEEWLKIFENYCIEELLSQSLAGRRLNFNRKDDSFIYKFKNKEEVEDRLGASFRSSDFVGLLKNYTFSFKTPGVTEAISVLQEYYPEWLVVIVFRKYEDVLASIVTKGWFDDTSPHKIRPFKQFGSSFVPLTIDDTWKKDWADLSVIERSIIYMNSQLSGVRNINNSIDLNYDQFTRNTKVLLDCFDKLNLEPTQKTYELIESIRFRDEENSILLKGVRPELLSEVKSLKQEFSI